ncbi:MAG: FlgD immunoglobulin-like domain containing protein [Candidatus Marinimicrobia bacterium]|nr:FlgD immunoglobulin-like domain containing protein [Candidatus Neomarinimicrobiota bacterium]
MRKSFLIITTLVLLASFGFGETVVSVIGTSTENLSGMATIPVNLTNTEIVAGLQFSIKDLPNQLEVFTVVPAGRCAAEEFDDADNNGIWTPNEDLTDLNGNGIWDGDYNVVFNDRDTTVSIVIYDAGGNAVIPGNGPICEIIYLIPDAVTDEIIDLRFHEILNADPQFLLVVTDPDGNAVNTTWLNGFLTVGGIEVTLGAGGGTPGYLSTPIQIEMNNAVPVKGIQLNIIDAVDYLSIESVVGLGRAADFDFVSNEVNGQSMLLGVNFSGAEIAPGQGAIAEVVFMIAANTPMEDIPLSISQLIVAAEGGIPLPSNGGDGIFSVTVGVDDQTEMPTEFALSQNYPNPFNPTTTIEYSIPEASEIHVGIYNLLGQEIRTLVSGEVQPGFYTTMWDGLSRSGARVESGVYLYRMSSKAGYNATKKLVLLK